MHTGGRLYYMDNLRALAMLAGVLFHAALAYSPLAHPLFPTADRDNAAIVDAFVWFLHLFRMPLFFLVSGFFAALLVQRRGIAGMFRNRLLHIALPFLLFWPLIHMTLSSSTLHAAEHALHPSPLLALIRQLLQQDALPQVPPGTSHLWFLYYLMIFYVLIWVGRSLELGRFAARMAAAHPLWHFALLPLLLTPALAAVPAPHPAPEGLFPQFWALAYYGIFFAFGYRLFGNPTAAEHQRRFAPWLVAASALLYGGFLALLDQQPAAAMAATASWPLALIQACISVWMTSACLSVGRAVLDRHHRGLRYLADASYWIYLVHLPILMLIQYRLMDLELRWPAKFGLSVLLTTAVCLLGYQLLVRHTVIGRLLGAARNTHTRPATA